MDKARSTHWSAATINGLPPSISSWPNWAKCRMGRMPFCRPSSLSATGHLRQLAGYRIVSPFGLARNVYELEAAPRATARQHATNERAPARGLQNAPAVDISSPSGLQPRAVVCGPYGDER